MNFTNFGDIHENIIINFPQLHVFQNQSCQLHESINDHEFRRTAG